MPERPHLKQWKRFLTKLAEKQRLVPEVEPCKGQGPRCWTPLVLLNGMPSNCNTAAMLTASRTAAKSRAGRGDGVGVGVDDGDDDGDDS